MYHKLLQDKKNLPQLLKEVASTSEQIIRGQATYPAAQSGKYPHINTDLSESGMGTKAVCEKFLTSYAPYLSGSAGPEYFGFVTGGSTPAALVGDWLTSVFDQNVMGSSESIASSFEVATIKLLRGLFSLPEEFNGSFVSGATMSNFVGLATGRQWIGQLKNVNIAEAGLHAIGDIKVFSATPHSSIYKSLAMAGMGRNALIRVDTLPQREAMDVGKLADLLKRHEQQSGASPCIIVANAGTVNTVDFDDLEAIVQLKKHYQFWLHVDAAFGGFARCSSKYQPLVKGLEFADSITIDAHKWLNVPYDSAMQFTRELTLQSEVFQNNASYLRADITANNFINLTPENSRRFRALPAWFTLMAYGKKGYEEMVERACELALFLGHKLEQNSHFKLLSPVRMNGICFTVLIKGQIASEKQIKVFLEKVIATGVLFLSPTLYKNQPALRISISNWQTEKKHIEKCWKCLLEAATLLKN
ncbi:MAG TPA: aspartate aminotransferase family protein [Aeromonadales bacterium]|nr:aspartate aminotransferase family protein [Aeromonadales bacterium]